MNTSLLQSATFLLPWSGFLYFFLHSTSWSRCDWPVGRISIYRMLTEHLTTGSRGQLSLTVGIWRHVRTTTTITTFLWLLFSFRGNEMKTLQKTIKKTDKLLCWISVFFFRTNFPQYLKNDLFFFSFEKPKGNLLSLGMEMQLFCPWLLLPSLEFIKFFDTIFFLSGTSFHFLFLHFSQSLMNFLKNNYSFEKLWSWN